MVKWSQSYSINSLLFLHCFSNPASSTMILMRCWITVIMYKLSGIDNYNYMGQVDRFCILELSLDTLYLQQYIPGTRQRRNMKQRRKAIILLISDRATILHTWYKAEEEHGAEAESHHIDL